MKLSILGIRGVPACHGGFETFAEKLSVYLSSRGWSVTVYCQVDDKNLVSEDSWNQIKRKKYHREGTALSVRLFLI